MKNRVIKSWHIVHSLTLSAASLLTFAMHSQPSFADEVWSTDEYDVVYQEDRNTTAVWTYGENGIIFIDGLGGIVSDHTAYSGYWVQPLSSRRCDTFREGADGEPSYYWGRFELTFIDSDFPSRWYANFGLCDQDSTLHLIGTPITAEPAP